MMIMMLLDDLYINLYQSLSCVFTVFLICFILLDSLSSRPQNSWQDRQTALKGRHFLAFWVPRCRWSRPCTTSPSQDTLGPPGRGCGRRLELQAPAAFPGL